MQTWFVNRNDEGPAFSGLFNPDGQGIKLETIALVLAAVRGFLVSCPTITDAVQVKNCLDEWESGEHVAIDFRERYFRDWYTHHLERLRTFARHRTLGAVCARMRKEMYQAAMCVFWSCTTVALTRLQGTRWRFGAEEVAACRDQ